jgi:hypothetical protein
VERNAVLAKTAKGLDEIKSRTHGLAQKLRSILIMVDGTATAGDILARFGGIPDVEAALETLVGQGFVEDADDLTARLERARTGVEFVAAAERSADMLGAIRGQAKAQSFRDRAKAFEQQFLAGR